MELLSLFLVFVKIGFTSFGGMSMVPVINEEMLTHGWMTIEDVSNILAIAEMTPGPLGINCATFAGMQVGGFWGGLIAVLGVLTPAFTTTLLVAVFYQRFKETSIMGNILYVIRPVCIGLMMAVICSISATTYFTANDVPDGQTLFIGAVSLFLLLFRKKNVISVICIAAILGLMLGVCTAL